MPLVTTEGVFNMIKSPTIRVGLVALLMSCGVATAIAAPGGIGDAADWKSHIKAENDQSYAKYRCVVLGDESACRPQTVVTSPYRLVPGPYATYLMERDGMDEAQALAQARGIGEEPKWESTKVEPAQALSSYQIYAREKGIDDPFASRTPTTVSRSK
jgi:hypothetical protein